MFVPSKWHVRLNLLCPCVRLPANQLEGCITTSLVHTILQTNAPLVLEDVIRGLEHTDSWKGWISMAAACDELSNALKRAGFICDTSDSHSSWRWHKPRGCAIVVFSWGPKGKWATREAGKQARRLLAASSKCSNRSYCVAFRGSSGGNNDSSNGRHSLTIADDNLFSESSLVDLTQSYIDRIGLRVSENQCRQAANLIGHLHMPDNPVDMVLQRFMQPLVGSLEVAASLQQQLAILRREAPFSCAAEYVESLSNEALQHMDASWWVKHYLISQCCGRVPPSLDGLSVGGPAKVLEGTRASVSAMSSANVHQFASMTTADLYAAVEKVLGPPPPGHVILYHGTTTSSLESIITDPDPAKGFERHDFGKAVYTTSHPRQALAWAFSKQIDGDPAAVVAWYIPVHLLDDLHRLRCDCDGEFKDTVYNWRVLEGYDLAAYRRIWDDSGFDLVTGPVAVLDGSKFHPSLSQRDRWKNAKYEHILPRDLGSSDVPLYGDQHAFRTLKGASVLCNIETLVCGIVLLQDGSVLTAEGGAARGRGGTGGDTAEGRGGTEREGDSLCRFSDKVGAINGAPGLLEEIVVMVK